MYNSSSGEMGFLPALTSILPAILPVAKTVGTSLITQGATSLLSQKQQQKSAPQQQRTVVQYVPVAPPEKEEEWKKFIPLGAAVVATALLLKGR